jgi:hypothetical protein
MSQLVIGRVAETGSHEMMQNNLEANRLGFTSTACMDVMDALVCLWCINLVHSRNETDLWNY